MPTIFADVTPSADWLQYGALGLLALVLVLGGAAVIRYVTGRDVQLSEMHTATLGVVKSNTEAHIATRECIVALPTQIKAVVESSVRDEFDRRSQK